MSAGQPELIDNRDRYLHADALRWLAEHRDGPISVASGYVRIGGLAALARLPGPTDRPLRLLIGALPPPGLGAATSPLEEPRQANEAFRETLKGLRRQRDFNAFPPSRRTAELDLVEALLSSERAQVRRFTTRFLHGKAYLFGDRDAAGELVGEGAALVTSANLTSGGLEHNLELGAVRYDPGAVRMALEWFDELWAESDDFRRELLDLLFPSGEVYDPQTIFQRALLELYGEEVEAEAAGEVRMGSIALTRFQEDGYRRARRIVGEFGGVIYADGVGTGKTEIGLRFVTDYAKERGLYTLVVTPAQLLDSLWRQRVIELGLPGEVISYQQLAADRQLTRDGGRRTLHLNKDAYRLVVIDEAHAFRNADNSWYAALDRLLGGTPKDLVLLTATPVNNSLWDLHNLVLLFARHDAAFRSTRLSIPSLKNLFIRAGANDPEQLSEQVLFPLVDAVAVRRDRSFLEEHYGDETFPDGTKVRFPEPVLRERRYDLDSVYPGIFKDVVATIDSLTMARYTPAKYEVTTPGEVAQQEALAGLMQSQLLKRFESSEAAARATLDRMIHAHEGLVTAWTEQDRVPSLRGLKDIVLAAQDGDPLSDVVEAALDEDAEARAASDYDHRFIEDVRGDLEKLRSIAERLKAMAGAADPKLDLLAEVLSGTEARKVVVFSSYADTLHHVADAIRSHPERFGGRAMTMVAGTETDTDQRVRELERFCPGSELDGAERPAADHEVDLLLSTDILSEGQNLQEAQAVVSFDLPWNPQRVVQRNGRIIRLRSPHERVWLYTLLPEQGGLEKLLKLEARVRGKIAAANATFGMESQVLSAEEAESRTYADLEEFFGRLAGGDVRLLDEGQGPGSGSFVGEQYRLLLSRLLQEGTLRRLRGLPWGIGSAFDHPAWRADHGGGIFFASRDSDDRRVWRFVTFDGRVVREDLEMLRLIDPGRAPRAVMPTDVQLERAWDIAAKDICDEHNALLDPKLSEAALPASQRWALGVLRGPDVPSEKKYSDADEALGVGRNQLIRRALSEARRWASEKEPSPVQIADRVVEVVEAFGLRPEPPPDQPARPISEEDLAVVCYQVVLAAR